MLLHIKDDANGTIQVILGKSYFQIGSFYVTLIMFFLHTRTGPRGKWFSLSLLRMHRTTVWVLSALIWGLDVHTWIYTSCRSRKKHDKDPTNAKLEDPNWRRLQEIGRLSHRKSSNPHQWSKIWFKLFCSKTHYTKRALLLWEGGGGVVVFMSTVMFAALPVIMLQLAQNLIRSVHQFLLKFVIKSGNFFLAKWDFENPLTFSNMAQIKEKKYLIYNTPTR